jgi:hypothetical protein
LHGSDADSGNKTEFEDQHAQPNLGPSNRTISTSFDD